MKINTVNIRNTSYQISSFIWNHIFESASLQYRHNQIQSRLQHLSSYLLSSAQLLENNESALSWNVKKGIKNKSNYTNWNALSQMMRKSVKTTIQNSFVYTCCQAKGSYASEYINGDVTFKLGDFNAKGKVQCSLWKKKQFDPKIVFTAGLSASALKANGNLSIGTDSVFGKVEAEGYAGYAYANATAVFTPTEQTFEAGIGAAALKGSVTCSFHLFGSTVTLTGSGSIGSAEANVSYSHKNREWEFGSKLGFICGLGFKVKVNY